MSEEKRTWTAKFADSFRGISVGVRGQKSFVVHIPVGAAVLIAAGVLGASLTQWAILILCITVVFAAELVNSAFEAIGHAITDDYDENVRDALDMISGAVLVVSTGAAAVGVLLLGYLFGVRLDWWG